MQIELNFFQSKVARRIFLLFVVSALIPLIFLAFFQIFQTERQIRESSLAEVRKEAKSMGMEIIGRLLHLENQLNLLGKAILFLASEKGQNEKNFIFLAPDFAAITFLSASGAIALKGKLLSIPAGMPSIPEGSSWITVQEGEAKKNSKVILVHRLDKKQYLLGQVGDIWDFDIPTHAKFWVIGPEDRLIRSNTAISPPGNLAIEKARKDSGAFAWEFGDTTYFVGYWKIFLRQRLYSQNWFIALAQPKASIFSQAKSLYALFIPIVVFALLLSLLLSQAQIRRYLIPLEKLRQATRRIARRDFTQPVNVKSNDEFEELGDAFNTMSKRLRQQFQTLSLLSTLDQAILATEKGEQVLRIIFERLRELVDYDLLVLGILQPSDKPNKKIHLLSDDPDHDAVQTRITHITHHELEQICNSGDSALNLTESDPPPYLEILVQHNIKYAFIFPIFYQEKVTALFCIGFSDINTFNECDTEQLHDVFYRASVAFTHAEWEARLYRQARYDDLTGLPNRLVLRDAMHEAIQRAGRMDNRCALMFVDLDNFKDINDAMGHTVGDYLLAQVAKRMQQAIGDHILLARIGGDEFTILITDLVNYETARHKCMAVAEKLLHSFKQPFNLRDIEYYASASIGIVIYPDDCKTADELLKCADMSMYKAKESGRSRYEFFSSELEDMVQERNRLLQDMHSALENKEFLLHFQPKVDQRNHELVGAEVLIRWHHPARGMISPELFVPLAEESNLIFPIGEWVIQSTCEQIKRWQNQGIKPPPLAVNLAAKQLTKQELGKKIQLIVKEYNIDPGCLEFEVTESALIENFRTTNLILNQINKIGSKVCIDDFGTGYSSLRYLRMLPVKTIKIDKIFIQGLPEDKKNINIVKAIVALASNLGMDLVTEGVENIEQAQLLSELGCFIQQGYYYSEPLAEAEFTRRFLKIPCQ
ncbi:EAL domain-containing protein [Legionella londiniensis]|uniref:Inner membrane protein/sensory box protein LssE n=1 Tax=Legionella londiniensis TaxID=45068 RepID=A0A0W0VJQ1_9GAMM|nr:EAL domain-containing protein [Legionella londiniensis]KTD20324.1 inner membrane protein/sensory box protein LssE [Legionella londiniensis]STX93926.1 inner membrane protein PLUS sensory box protein LssE [Legionella londiniensis]